MKTILIIIVILVLAGVGIGVFVDNKHQNEDVDYIAQRVDDLDNYVTGRYTPPGGLGTSTLQAAELRRLSGDLNAMSDRWIGGKRQATQQHIDGLLKKLDRRGPFG